MIFYFNNKIPNEKNNSKWYYDLQGFAEIQPEHVAPIGSNVPGNAGLPLVWDIVWKQDPLIITILGPRPAEGNITYLCNPGTQQELAK